MVHPTTGLWGWGGSPATLRNPLHITAHELLFGNPGQPDPRQCEEHDQNSFFRKKDKFRGPRVEFLCLTWLAENMSTITTSVFSFPFGL